ncbi:MAG: polysaccharide biosynthesis protein, partial [Proteobacteria bacterium]
MINRLAESLVGLPRPMKRSLALTVDALLCWLCVWLALSLRYEAWTPIHDEQWFAVVFAVALALPLFVFTGQYRAIFRYTDSAALLSLTRACGVFTLIYMLVFSAMGLDSVPRSLGLLVPMMLFFTVGLSRLAARYWLGGLYLSLVRRKARSQVVIYGAGSAGRQLAAALVHNPDMALRAFVDDAVQLQGSSLRGINIRSLSWLRAHATSMGITDVLLAMPSSSHVRRAQILNELLPLGLHVRT